MLKPALLVLTAMSDGGTRVTLSEAESPQDCEASRAAVVQILTDAGRAPVLAMCGQSDLTLTPFEHGLPPEAEIHRYRVTIPGDGSFEVEPLAMETDCAEAAPRVYCARSAQQVVSGR